MKQKSFQKTPSIISCNVIRSFPKLSSNYIDNIEQPSYVWMRRLRIKPHIIYNLSSVSNDTHPPHKK